jgi:hypothetical protein
MQPAQTSDLRSTPERLAYWYFRLNGFMTTENFLIHPETREHYGTEADIFATRFRHRRENIDRPMTDDPRVCDCPTFANIIVAEVKRGLCELNGPWTNRSSQNMTRVLKAIGCVDDDDVELAAESLYESSRWSNNDTATVRLFAVGERTNGELSPDLQIVWPSVIEFCIDRFTQYRRLKAPNRQWSEDGKHLMKLALDNDVGGIRRYFGLNPPGAAL